MPYSSWLSFQAHIVFQHIAESLEKVNSDPSLPAVGLGYFSEQAMESVHHDVKVRFLYLVEIILQPFWNYQVAWDRVKVAIGHPDFAEKLLAFISAYNAKHL